MPIRPEERLQMEQERRLRASALGESSIGQQQLNEEESHAYLHDTAASVPNQQQESPMQDAGDVSPSAPPPDAQQPSNRNGPNGIPSFSSLFSTLMPLGSVPPGTTAASPSPTTTTSKYRPLIHICILFYVIASILSVLDLFYRIVVLMMGESSAPASSSPWNYERRFSTLLFVTKMASILISTVLYVLLALIASLSSCFQYSQNPVTKLQLYSKWYMRFIIGVVFVEILMMMYRYLIVLLEADADAAMAPQSSSSSSASDLLLSWSFWVSVLYSVLVLVVCCGPCVFCAVRYKREIESMRPEEGGASGGSSSTGAPFPGVGRTLVTMPPAAAEQDPVHSQTYADNDTQNDSSPFNEQRQMEMQTLASASKCIVPGCDNYGNDASGGMCNEHFQSALASPVPQRGQSEPEDQFGDDVSV